MKRNLRILFVSVFLAALAKAQYSKADEEIPEDTFNILSLDGGGIRGIITAYVVDYMESYAFEYANKEYCYQELEYAPGVDRKQLPMFMLFDLVAGTSTGSLLATAIVLPNNNTAMYPEQKNKFFAEDAIRIYKENGSTVFKKFTYSLTTLILGITAFTALGALIGYNIGVALFSNPRHEEAMKSFHAYIK
jgi:hypothetical protein